MRCTWRGLAGEGAHAITPLLASVQLANSIAMALPLTACGLIAVRDVGFGAHPEWLIAYDASMFAPSLAGVLFGLLSDCVPIGCRRARARGASRMRWVMLGMLGAAGCLAPFAADVVRSPARIFVFGIGGAVFIALTGSSIEGVMVERGREVAEDISAGDALSVTRIRSAVQALDYQVRGVGAVIGYGASALLLSAFPPHSAIGAGMACYALAALLASRYAHTAGRRTAPAGERASALAAGVVGAPAGEAPEAPGGAYAPGDRGERKCAQLRRGARAPQVRVAALAALAALVYQLPPTIDDTFQAYIYSGSVAVSPAALSATSTAALLMSTVVAPALCVRLSLAAPATFALGALADALGGLARLLFVSLAPAAAAAGAARLTSLYVAASCAAALLDGIAFVPIVALAALAAPAGAEATVFELVLTAQTAGSLLAAYAAAALTTRLHIGMPPAALLLPSAEQGAPEERSWDGLPRYILLCCVLKLAILLPVLPILRACMRIVTGTGTGTGGSERGGDWRRPLSQPLLDSVADSTAPGARHGTATEPLGATTADGSPLSSQAGEDVEGEEERDSSSTESSPPVEGMSRI